MSRPIEIPELAEPGERHQANSFHKSMGIPVLRFLLFFYIMGYAGTLLMLIVQLCRLGLDVISSEYAGLVLILLLGISPIQQCRAELSAKKRSAFQSQA